VPLIAKLLASLTVSAIPFSPLLAQTMLPPGSVDGVANPDQIPDTVAFRLFSAGLNYAGPTAHSAGADATATLQPTPRQKAKLRPIALSAADEGILLWQAAQWQSAIGAKPTTVTVDLDSITESQIGSLKRR